MHYFLAGIAAFTLFIVYDITQSIHIGGPFRFLFFAGCLLLAASAAGIAADAVSRAEWIWSWRSSLGAAAALPALSGLIYSLFFALPFPETYIKNEKRPVYDKGVYALCRHPGVPCFILLFAALWLFCNTGYSFIAFILFSSLNILYSAAQDFYFFPRIFSGYGEYRRATPFLIPTPSSVKRCVSYFSGAK